GGNPAKRCERQSFDHLLIGDDLVGTRRQEAVDALDREGMLECDRFVSRANGHDQLSFRKPHPRWRGRYLILYGQVVAFVRAMWGPSSALNCQTPCAGKKPIVGEDE